METIKNGVYTDISIEDYHENKSHISTSSLKRAKKSLKEFEWYRSGKMEDGKKLHFDFGNAFELALCEGVDAMLKEVYIFDIENRPEKDKGITSKINQSWKKEIFASNKLVINGTGAESLETIYAMLDSCNDDPTIKNIIFDKEALEFQASIFWKDPNTGLNLKTRPDLVQPTRSIIVDVKTTIDGSPSKFGRDSANYDYPIQAIQQIDGAIESGLMESVENYFYLVVEKVAPYNATLYELETTDIEWLRDSYEGLKNKVAGALESGDFKGYNYASENKYGIIPLEIPIYYKNNY